MNALPVIAVALLTGCLGALLVALSLAAVYPVLRRELERIRPTIRAGLLVGLTCLPAVLGGTLSIFTARAPFTGGLLPDHCHGSGPAGACIPHAPLGIGSVGQAAIVAGLLAILFATGWPVLHRLRRWAHLRAQLRVSGRHDAALDALILEAEAPLALSAGGLRPCVAVSSGLVRHLAPHELSIVLAHERAHARRRDGLRQAIATLAARVFPASVRKGLLDDLSMAAEEACDALAAKGADRLAVAETLLKIERLWHGRTAPAMAGVSIAGGSLTRRVEVLLAPPAQAGMGSTLAVPLLALALAAGLFGLAEPLHRGVESLLFIILG